MKLNLSRCLQVLTRKCNEQVYLNISLLNYTSEECEDAIDDLMDPRSYSSTLSFKSMNTSEESWQKLDTYLDKGQIYLTPHLR